MDFLSVAALRGLAAIGLLICLACTEILAAYTWSNVQIGGGGYVTGIVYHPTEQNLRYNRTDVGGAYRWDQYAARWVALNDDIGGLNNEFMALGVLSLALDPDDADYVYLACGQYLASWAPAGRILRSTDRGATWTRITLPFKLAGNADGRGTGERLVVDPHDSARLFLGTSDSGLWTSANRGDTWTRLTSFTPASTTFVLPDPSTPGVIYVGVPDSIGPSLWRTADGGASWSAVPNQPTGLMALQGALDAAGTLYLTYGSGPGPNGVTSGAVRKLAGAATATSAGAWTTINPPSDQGGYCGLSLDPRRPGVVIVSTLNRWYPRDEIYYSENGGASWKGVLDGAMLDRSSAPWVSTITPHWISDVEIDPFDSARVTFVTGFGLFETTNLTVVTGKPSWSFANAGLEETVPTALVSPAAGPPLISTIGDFGGFRHDNLNAAPLARHTPNSGTNRSLDGAGAAPSVLVRLHNGGGTISRNGASTWTTFPTTPPTVAANSEGRITVSADGARILWCPVNSAPYWSADDGQSWTASTGTPTGASGSLIPAADRAAATDFYFYDPSGRRVYRSTDGGAAFALVSPQLPSGTGSLSAVPGHPGELWATCGGNGLRRLSNNGAILTTINTVQAAYALGFGKAATDATHPAVFIWGTIGGATGLYRSDNIGVGWTRINDNAHQFGRIGALTGDPRLHGRVYVASSGRGILVGEPELAPPPEPPVSIPLFEDALGAGWNNWSWATVNLSAASPTRRGARAIAVEADGYEGLYFNRAAMSTAGYNAFGFWIHGGASGGQSLRVSARRSGAGQPAVTFPSPAAGTWARVVVPLAALGVGNISDLTGFVIENNTGSPAPVFYVDDVTLVGQADAAAWEAAADVIVTLGSLSAVYDGNAKFATATTSPVELPVLFSYGGGPNAPSAVGSHAVVGTVDAPGNRGVASGTLVIRTSLAAFRAEHFTPSELSQSAVSGPLADPDFDGLPNLLEYAFGLDPKLADSGAPMMTELVDGHLAINFPRRRESADLDYAVEASADLENWSSGPFDTEELAVQPINSDLDRVTLRHIAALDAASPRRFLRLRINLRL